MNGFGKKDKLNNRDKIRDAKQSIQKIVDKAIRLHLKGNISEAKKYYEYCVNIGVKDYRVFSNYGSILKDIGQLNKAEILTRKSIEINPEFVNAYYNLGSILIDLGRFEEAEIFTQKAIRLNPNDENFYHKLGIIQTELGKSKDAEISLRNAIKIKPNDFLLHQSLAIILLELDKQKDAELTLYKSIKINPNSGKNYYLLSTFNFLNEKMEEKLFSKGILNNQNEEDLIDIYFARANQLDKKSYYSKASEYFIKANNLNLKLHGSDYLDFQSKMKSFYIKPQKDKNISSKHVSNPFPIFIVGMPRAGKTITESILACNDRTIKCGEDNALESAVKIYLEKKNEKESPSLFKLYIDNLRNDYKLDSYICSTTPLNLIYTGLIISEMKNAKVIFCHRNPLDNIIKIYQKHLGCKHTYSSSIRESANMWLETYSLMERYKENNNSQIYFLNYEDLIKEQEKEVKSLIKWLGWEYNDRYLKPRIDASTLSSSDNLNNNEIRIWTNYRELLAPAIETLENNQKDKTII